MKKETKEKLISWLGAKLIRAVGSTLRIRIQDEVGFTRGGEYGAAIISFWHNRLFVMPELFKRYYPKRKGVVMLISQSRDGTFISNITRRLGLEVINGSSSRGGSAAARMPASRPMAPAARATASTRASFSSRKKHARRSCRSSWNMRAASVSGAGTDSWCRFPFRGWM